MIEMITDLVSASIKEEKTRGVAPRVSTPRLQPQGRGFESPKEQLDGIEAASHKNSKHTQSGRILILLTKIDSVKSLA